MYKQILSVGLELQISLNIARLIHDVLRPSTRVLSLPIYTA